MESKITYFEKAGPENTGDTLGLVRERLNSSGIRKIVIASTFGDTARKAMEFFKDDSVKLIVIPHQHDFKRPENPFAKDLVSELRKKGHEVHFATMLFHTEQLYGNASGTAIANVLRCFCQGVKVCLEIVMMATDAGYLANAETVIAISGTGRGADTALVMQAGSSQNVKNLRVNEIICKPLNTLHPDG